MIGDGCRQYARQPGTRRAALFQVAGALQGPGAKSLQHFVGMIWIAQPGAQVRADFVEALFECAPHIRFRQVVSVPSHSIDRFFRRALLRLTKRKPSVTGPVGR